MKGRILIIEDCEKTGAFYQTALEQANYPVLWCDCLTKALEAAKQEKFRLVLTDLMLPDGSGFDLITKLKADCPDVPIVMITGHGGVEQAIEATKRGAYDYLEKPVDIEELLLIIRQALDRVGVETVSDTVSGNEPTIEGGNLIGHSRAMQAIYKDIGRAAVQPVTVLIRGETGTGKELIARAVHAHSSRNNKPFMAVNCAALPETLLESELFGHERGAFTGAHNTRIGWFEQAQGGTLFLDEIGDMSLATQSRLLRVLQEKVIQRVGSTKDIQVNVRIIAATHRNLEEMIVEQKFREDLYHRIAMAVIEMPPLRERVCDIPLLAVYFLKRYSEAFSLRNPGIEPEALDYLSMLPWKGNVRELENIMRRLILAARGLPITMRCVREICTQVPVSQPNSGVETNFSIFGWIEKTLDQAMDNNSDHVRSDMIAELDKVLLSQTLARNHGNRTRTARMLGLTRPTLLSKMREYGLDQDDKEKVNEVSASRTPNDPSTS
jgi:DNA-binding NtrC family response regulator